MLCGDFSEQGVYLMLSKSVIVELDLEQHNKKIMCDLSVWATGLASSSCLMIRCAVVCTETERFSLQQTGYGWHGSGHVKGKEAKAWQ